MNNGLIPETDYVRSLGGNRKPPPAGAPALVLPPFTPEPFPREPKREPNRLVLHIPTGGRWAYIG